jgi:hypothetical protein
MKSQTVFHFADCSTPSFLRTPESSNIKVLLDAGVRRHDGKLRFPTFCPLFRCVIPAIAIFYQYQIFAGYRAGRHVGRNRL